MFPYGTARDIFRIRGPGTLQQCCYQNAYNERTANKIAIQDAKIYGAFDKIIIPVNRKFIERRIGKKPDREDGLSIQMAQLWEPINYKTINS